VSEEDHVVTLPTRVDLFIPPPSSQPQGPPGERRRQPADGDPTIEQDGGDPRRPLRFHFYCRFDQDSVVDELREEAVVHLDILLFENLLHDRIRRPPVEVVKDV
jgi:hypothetical protein